MEEPVGARVQRISTCGDVGACACSPRRRLARVHGEPPWHSVIDESPPSLDNQVVPGSAMGSGLLIWNRLKAQRLRAKLFLPSAGESHRELRSRRLQDIDPDGEQRQQDSVWHCSALPLSAAVGVVQRLMAISWAPALRRSTRQAAGSSATSNPLFNGAIRPHRASNANESDVSRTPRGSTEARSVLELTAAPWSRRSWFPSGATPRSAAALSSASSEAAPAASTTRSSVLFVRSTAVDVEAGPSLMPIPEPDGPSNEEDVFEPGPYLLVEHCINFLPPDLACLPEFDLGEGLSRSLHCYAHGGFMGAAISLLAEPDWKDILKEAMLEASDLLALRMVRNGWH